MISMPHHLYRFERVKSLWPNRAHGPSPWRSLLLATALLGMSSLAMAEDTNSPAGTNTPATAAAARPAPGKLDESSFRIVSERNIFNANRSGGSVRIASTRRPPRVESFKLVGTMAYEKGTFAFFEGSNSELTKVLKAEGVIASHKVVAIQTDSVKLEAGGKIVDLPIGAAMRREDEGAWQLGEAVASSGNSSYVSSRENGDSNRNGRSRDRNDDSRSRRNGSDSERGGDSSRSTPTAPTSSASTESAADVLKRLAEKRAKEESQ
jgi:hypothetical protein